MEEPVQLLPLAQKQRGGRRTMKRGRVQRGGADFVAIPDENRRTAWATALGSEPVWAGRFADARPDLTDDAAKKTAVLQYVNAVMRQDELMETAIKIIREKNNVTGDEQAVLTAAAAATDKVAYIEYIADVERLVTFKTTYKNNTTQVSSKITEINKSPDETLSTLILYPSRVKNIFIEALAVIAIQIKHNKQAPMNLAIMDNDNIQKIQADHFKSYAEGLAFINTAYGLRDGFYLGQATGVFTGIIKGKAIGNQSTTDGNFWLKFVKAMRSCLTTSDTIKDIIGDNTKNVTVQFPESANTSIFTYRGTQYRAAYNTLSIVWAELAAAIIASYIKSTEPTWGTFTLLKGMNKAPTTGLGLPNDSYVPNAPLHTVVIGDTGMTLGALYKQFPFYVVHFILHLSYTIQKLEPTVKNMVLPAVAAASGAAAAGAGTT